MAASELDGPLIQSGALAAIQALLEGNNSQMSVPDPNPDAGPALVYQGEAFLDPRFWFPKDQIVGRPGVVVSHLFSPLLRSIAQVPAALSASNIAAAQNVVDDTAMTLASAGVAGITLAVPVRELSDGIGALNSVTPTTAAIALDFGFAFGSCVANSATIEVASSTDFEPGMPLVIGEVGNSGGTVPLLTRVATLVDATHITVASSAVPLRTNTAAPIGTGDLWRPQNDYGLILPQAAMPFLAGGPGLFLDPRQALSRGVRIVGSGGATGGDFLVSGWDIYGEPMSETVAVAAGASTGWSTKAFKYIGSVTPQFTDAHNYSVGTADVFGFAYLTATWEETLVSWAGTMMTTSTGWVGGDTTSPATATTDDVRGTIQISTNGGGSGITGSASNGSVSGLRMSGRRLEMNNRPEPWRLVSSGPIDNTNLFGQVQA